MLEKFFSQPKTLLRLKSGPLGPYLPAVAQSLVEAQYSTATIRLHLRAADHFGAWLQKQQIGFDEVESTTVDRYLRQLGRSGSPVRRPKATLGLQNLVRVLQQQGVLTSPVPPPLSSVEQYAAQFDHHLDRTVGCAARTRVNYLCYAHRFLREVFPDGEVDWSHVNAAVVTSFVRQQAARLQPSACGQPVTAMRSLLRFLASQGLISDGLLGAVPAVRTWRHASLPRILSLGQVKQVLTACDTSSSYGLRERVILLLLARLGLRSGEVIRLRLDDIDWVRACILIRPGKTRQERKLPLSQELGDALATYLCNARPSTEYRELFLRWRPPFRPLCSSVSICALVQRVLRRAGITIHRPGAHVFRHTLATEMANTGATFKTIADVLGHQSLASTEIYAKLNLGSLSGVAMPWPGGAK